jgi:hypothetical protein
LDGDAVVLAGFARSEFGQIVEMEVDVVRHEEIGIPIAVIVAKRGSRGPTGIPGQAGLFGNVGEGAVAVVALENDPAEAGDE